MKNASYGEAINRKYPEQVVFAVSADEEGRADIIVLGWAMPTSGEPPMWAISVGHTRYSHELISKGGEFVLCFPNAKMTEEMLFCGSNSGRDVDKIAGTGLQVKPAAKVKPPLIEGCAACFECIVEGRLETGDHTIFAGRVVASHVADDASVKRLYNWGGEFSAAVPEK